MNSYRPLALVTTVAYGVVSPSRYTLTVTSAGAGRSVPASKLPSWLMSANSRSPRLNDATSTTTLLDRRNCEAGSDAESIVARFVYLSPGLLPAALRVNVILWPWRGSPSRSRL